MPHETTDARSPAEPFPGFIALREEVEAALRATCSPGSAFLGGRPRRLADAMRHSLLAGGKRMRPVLTLAAHAACGADPSRRGAAVTAAQAVEMVHTYSLVHDDLPCMDDDDLRRGRPTCHVAFDEATAVLAGDALLTLAFDLLSRVQSAEIGLGCVSSLARAAGAVGMVGGQAQDLEAEANPAFVSDGAALEAIHRRKTGALIACACELGAITARAGDDRLFALRDYGESLGLAFQIADDLLDLTADAAALGKTAGKDVAAGKLTYPALYGMEGSRARAAELIDAALAALEPLGGAADPLRALARYAVERDR